MTVRELRDHSEPCDHINDPHPDGGYLAYYDEDEGGWMCISPCPGGKLVTLEKRELDDVPMQVNGHNVYEVYVMVSDDE